MSSATTIFALSSGSGRAGIAVVRLSGPSAFVVAEALCGNLPSARHAGLREIRSRNGDLIDRGLVLVFPGPGSATGEDLAEFHLHGSTAVVGRFLDELAAQRDCRAAEAGEFTRRAFAHDRLDLVEVEGLADLLAAESEPQRKLAMRQFSGEASSIYLSWHAELVKVLAIIEAAIDFADEDGVAAQALALARPRVADFRLRLEQALSDSEKASGVRRGLRVVIAGAPNVGKSSLLNVLAGRKAAIVSEVAGTTRDVVEAAVMVAGLPVVLADTAGLRTDTQDMIEQEGVARSYAEMGSADILIWVRSAVEDSLAVPARLPDITVVNKVDLVSRESILLRNESELLVSTQSGEGLGPLNHRLGVLVSERTNIGENGIMVRARHRAAITDSIRYLNDALGKPDDALELMAEDVRKAAFALASVTGRVEVEEFLGQIFSEFCVGK